MPFAKNSAQPEWTFQRRTFLAAAAAAPAASALAAKPERPYIDAHVHVWTPDTNTYSLKKGFAKVAMRPPSFTPEQLFNHCHPVGVGRIVLIQMSFYGYDNSYMLDMMKKHSGVFSGVAVIDEEAAPAQRMRELKQRGVRGFRIRPTRGEQWLATPGMQAMWKCGAEG